MRTLPSLLAYWLMVTFCVDVDNKIASYNWRSSRLDSRLESWFLFVSCDLRGTQWILTMGTGLCPALVCGWDSWEKTSKFGSLFEPSLLWTSPDDRYKGLLFGDISAVCGFKRVPYLQQLLEATVQTLWFSIPPLTTMVMRFYVVIHCRIAALGNRQYRVASCLYIFL